MGNSSALRSKKLTDNLKHELEKVFREMDVDMSKSLTIEECMAYWKKFPMINTSLMITQVDRNNDGVITYDEWMDFWELLYNENDYTEEMLLAELNKVTKNRQWVLNKDYYK